ncbi:hypothetical protein MTX26_08925 [Bradyrhizobium sp. ISRA443]|uniref:hypothetical protein n=1 Tax=unclassified Bradyrhizobium TaxID=2631580 RepID=UPI0024793A93|nr:MULTISPECIES: hypothetical protein [unclassified Bradyrhizobium]WGR95801.1 hypothetical protein MTX20_19225 [Bradyrhizobium sp. ISRA435]WGS00924.1 hypothetical protein MTX23_08920 [Bradyrhizobium sp. ISRA436]WGS07811.1 hypothetical protein MTX18_08925 [Bradyrhizobium sp. ISRA437]WGS14699.1 hypothetical protein MTX26_08925 [Bradyrhizobium sp. ISRA443]
MKIIGVAAHIRAAAPGGPRFDASQTPAERSSIRNALWLCGSCSILIDKNAGLDFSIHELEEWKSRAEASSAKALLFGGSFRRPDWLDRIHYAQFINIPRLGAMLGNPNLQSLLGLDPLRGFRGQGLELASKMHWVVSALVQSSVEAIPLDDILPASEEMIGQLISFEHRCYTRNGVDGGTAVSPQLLSKFDPKRSPHFYIKTETTRVVFPYDPAWVTTSTAYSDFRGGHRRFAGIGIVKAISDDATEIIVSPLIVAFPRNEFMQAFYGALD